MKLPIANRKWSIMKVIAILILIIILSFVIQNVVKELRILSLIVLCLGLFYILKNNIQLASFDNEEIKLKYNWQKIIIPIIEINSIHSGVAGYNDFKNPWTTFYTLRLNKKYFFGKTLLLKYRHKDFPLKEPIEIAIMKAIIVNNIIN